MPNLVDYDISDFEGSTSSEEQETEIDDPGFSNGDDATHLSDVSLLSTLPKVHSSRKICITAEPVLEEMVKPKNWEKKYAEKTERKRQKIRKRHSKEVEISKVDNGTNNALKKKRKKTQILAFGAISGLDVDEDRDVSRTLRTAEGNCGLLSMLPAPVSAVRGMAKARIVGIPRSLSRTNEIQQVPTSEKKTTKPQDNNEDSDVEEPNCDFFGLSSMDKNEGDLNISEEPSVEIDPSLGSSQNLKMFDMFSPNSSEETDMIFSNDLASYGDKYSATLNNIIDVSVDQALGPDVHANLLKNLHNKTIMEASLAHLPTGPKARNNKDAVARRKHQITYLANVAVAREELLVEQWSQNRHAKRISAHKYGF